MKRIQIVMCGLVLAGLGSQASAQIFSSGPGLALPIPDNTYNGTQGVMLCNTINVPSGGGGGDFVDSATVLIGMSHTFVGDLTIKLFPPTGTAITLVSRPGVIETADDGNDTAGFGENSNLAIASPLTYDDSAPNPSEMMGKIPSDHATGDVICVFAGSPCSYASSNGAATPGNLSSGMDGRPKVGAWQLCIGDSAGADTGVLDLWTLTIVGQPTPVELQQFSIE